MDMTVSMCGNFLIINF
jgi:hypothetical protein